MWNLREKQTKRFRNRESFKKDLNFDSNEPWELRRLNNKKMKR